MMSCARTAQAPLGELGSAPGSVWRMLRKGKAQGQHCSELPAVRRCRWGS